MNLPRLVVQMKLNAESARIIETANPTPAGHSTDHEKKATAIPRLIAAAAAKPIGTDGVSKP